MAAPKLSEQYLSGADAAKLLAWMRSVGHVESVTALELMNGGNLTALHAEYFRRAMTGETYAAFRSAREGT